MSLDNPELLPDFVPNNDDTEVLFLEKIRSRVSQLLIEDSGLLFSYLYRMDIEEKILSQILEKHRGEDLVNALSKEILERQKERIAIKSRVNVPKIKEEGWEF